MALVEGIGGEAALQCFAMRVADGSVFRARVVAIGVVVALGAACSAGCGGASPPRRAPESRRGAGPVPYTCVVATPQKFPDLKCDEADCKRRCERDHEGAACFAWASHSADVFVETEPNVYERRVDAKKALPIYTLACDAGLGAGCFNAAAVANSQGRPYGEVARMLDRGCRLGNTRSCGLLADALYDGRLGASGAHRSCAMALYDGLCKVHAFEGCVDHAAHEPDPNKKRAILRSACRIDDDASHRIDYDACEALIALEQSLGHRKDVEHVLTRLCLVRNDRGACQRACALSVQETCPEGLERLDRK